ncbi:hypothetical protein [Mycobacterium kansasii]|uniref:hypothetical protein n=1 Tax=Mycobacterium kansasii TaxID=1768 RepID=UPI0018DB8ED0|nr:hypothetical protein [Mycobacterium kansasii]
MRVLQPTLWAGRLNKIMATRKRHSPEQIVRKLTLADRLLSSALGYQAPAHYAATCTHQ